MLKNFKYYFPQLPEIIEILKPKLRIAVVHGGDKTKPHAVFYKTHNPRSWKSYQVVANDIRDALAELGFKYVYVMPDDLTLLSNLKDKSIHFAWLNTGGVQGYIPTAHAASMLEMSGIPYVGHNPQNAAILDNKHIFKYMLQKFDINTADFIVWSRTSISKTREKDLAQIQQVFGNYQGPFVIKPTSGRASLNIYYVESLDELFTVINQVYAVTQNLVIIEKFMSGREYCTSICGPVICQHGKFHKYKRPFAFSHIERVLEQDEKIFTSMDKKPITEKRIRVCEPEKEKTLIQILSAMAQEIYTKFFLETLVRIDFRADENENIYVLETNPKPDLKRPTADVTNLTCTGLPQYKMSYTDLILGIMADKLDFLLSYRSKNIAHIIDLL